MCWLCIKYELKFNDLQCNYGVLILLLNFLGLWVAFVGVWVYIIIREKYQGMISCNGGIGGYYPGELCF